MLILGLEDKMEYTVLYRENGAWHRVEITRLVAGLDTTVSNLELCPEYLVLFGHYTKEKALRALLGGEAFTATQIVGSKELPFPVR